MGTLTPQSFLRLHGLGNKKQTSFRVCNEHDAIVLLIDGQESDVPGIDQKPALVAQLLPLNYCLPVASVGADPVVGKPLQRIDQRAGQCRYSAAHDVLAVYVVAGVAVHPDAVICQMYCDHDFLHAILSSQVTAMAESEERI